MAANEIRFPNNFKFLIKRQGYNISEVAKELGISPRTMTNYLSGISSMPGDLRKKLALTICCDFDELQIYEPHVEMERPLGEHVDDLGGVDMDTLRRRLLEKMGMASATFLLSPQATIAQENNSKMGPQSTESHVNEEYINFLENEMMARWDLYHIGGANRALVGLDTWINQMTKLPRMVQETKLHNRALALLTMSYQLQSCVQRDKMQYPLAHIAHQNAFHTARELGDQELVAAALAREGLTYLQQEKPKEAIIYLTGALEIIANRQFPALNGYIQQALSEAYAKAQQPQESWASLGMAEDILALLGITQERNPKNQSRLNVSSVTAQRGVNTTLLGDYKQAVEFIDEGLKTYNPSLIRGRARLIAHKAESYYGLHAIDACTASAQEALMLANAVGSDKTIFKIKDLYAQLNSSSWRKERGALALGDMLS